jgi:hypothetical protein
MYVSVAIYVCVCVYCIGRKKKDSHFGREKKIVRKQNYISACFTFLQLNVTLLNICVCVCVCVYVSIHVYTYAYIYIYIHIC